jgi:cyclohexanecarboxylate-CoA ligase
MDLGVMLTPDRIAAMEARGDWAGRTVVDYLEDTVAAVPDRTAVIATVGATGGTTTLTYADLDRLARRIALGLHALGVGPGDVVSFQLPNWWQFTALHLACVHIGAISNPLMPIFRERELRFMLGFAETKVYVAPVRFRGFDYAAMMRGLAPDLPQLERCFYVGGDEAQSFERQFLDRPHEDAPGAAETLARRRTRPNDVTQILYTSGTTGQPKGVMHTANTLFACLPPIVARFGMGADDVCWMASPLAHQTGFMYGMLLPIMLGVTSVLHDVWDPAKAAASMQATGATFTMASTPFLADLADLPTLVDYDLSRFRIFLSAGAPIPRSLVERATERLGAHILSGWGMTEIGCITNCAPGDPPEKIFGTDGKALPGSEVRVVTHDGRIAPVDEEGLLQSRPNALFVGYLKRPAVYGVDAEGWLDTGDYARMDADGYIRITGRAKDIIIRGGENVPVVEVEELLYRHPAVRECAIVAMPDARLGERACAFVGLVEDVEFDFAAMIAYLEAHGMARQYFPEKLVIRDDLPRTPSGKIQKFMLREEAKAFTPER